MAGHPYLKLTHLEASILLELLGSVNADTVLPDGFTLTTSGRVRAFRCLTAKAEKGCEGACIGRKPPVGFPTDPDLRWADDSIQFPRLISEVFGVIDPIAFKELLESMDLTRGQLEELVARADKKWETIKDEH